LRQRPTAQNTDDSTTSSQKRSLPLPGSAHFPLADSEGTQDRDFGSSTDYGGVERLKNKVQSDQ
jgi:hypothetical protein